MFRHLRSYLSDVLPSNSNEEPFAVVVPNTYAYPGAPMDPNRARGLANLQTKGGIQDVKSYLDNTVRLANDNTKKNAERKDAIYDSYDVTLAPNAPATVIGPTQVFAAGIGEGNYVYTFQDAPAVCARYGARLATTKELEDAQKKGADWCFSGWVQEHAGKWPITTSVIPGCGNRQGIIEWTPGPQAGVNCYGPKPLRTDPRSSNILPFNASLWDEPTEPIYTTVTTGYLETTGPQPACFSGLTPEQAQENCNNLGSACVGFSYSKHGDGFGCYKGNHDAGINGNPNYMGYVKTPIPPPRANGPWKCLSGIPTPIRRNTDGDIECMSGNNRDCYWQPSDWHCQQLVNNPPGAIAPLICGAMHTQKWGGPGYDNPGHWCYQCNQREQREYYQ